MNAAASPENGDSTYAKYVPHELKYDAQFEDSVMRVVLTGDKKEDGVRIILHDSTEAAEEGISIQATDIQERNLPAVDEDELPLALTDPRRVFSSPLPGVKLTHPYGYLEGGPGLDPDEDTFARDFLSSNREITSQEELRAAVENEIESSAVLLRERMEDRQRAIEHNEQIEKDIRTLIDQHDMEARIQQRLVTEHKAKVEAREKRKREREGG